MREIMCVYKYIRIYTDRHLLFIFKNVFRDFHGLNKHKLFIYLLLLKNTCKTFIYLAVLGLSCGTWISLPSMEPGPPALECGVFATGPPGESRSMLFRQTLPYLGVLKWFLILCLYNRSYSESSSQNTVLFISDFILQRKTHKFLRPILKEKCLLSTA